MGSGCSNNGQEKSSKQDLLQGMSSMKYGASVNSEVRQKEKKVLKNKCVKQSIFTRKFLNILKSYIDYCIV